MLWAMWKKTVLKDEISNRFPGSFGGCGGLHYGTKQGCACGCCPVLLGLPEEDGRSMSSVLCCGSVCGWTGEAPAVP